MVIMNNRPKRILSLISAILIFVLGTFTGAIKAEAAVSGQAIVDYSKKFLGKPYSYGAAGPNSFDCSGLTYYVYNQAAGINIGRTTYDQINAGREVSRNELQLGDLVFTSSNHVGIYVGNNQMIHSPQTGDVVKISTISKFWRARRILNSSNQPVSLNSTNNKVICNTSFYSWKYDDLARAFGNNSTSLYNHYLNYGIREGRMASQTFDVAYYLNHNADLINAFGRGNYTAAYNHFLTYGYREGRDLSPIFNLGYYIENNPDVKNAFGDDYQQIILHFLNHGMSEGRLSSTNFNLQAYKSRYEDLRNAYGQDNVAYYNHYLVYGIAEGRVAK